MKEPIKSSEDSILRQLDELWQHVAPRLAKTADDAMPMTVKAADRLLRAANGKEKDGEGRPARAAGGHYYEFRETLRILEALRKSGAPKNG